MKVTEYPYGYCHFALEVAFSGRETGIGSFFDMMEKFWSQGGFDWRSICGLVRQVKQAVDGCDDSIRQLKCVALPQECICRWRPLAASISPGGLSGCTPGPVVQPGAWLGVDVVRIRTMFFAR